MSDQQKKGVIIDAATFRRIPRHIFRYPPGTEHKVYGFTQLRENERNDIRTIDARLEACTRLEEQRAVLLGAVLSFFPEQRPDDDKESRDRTAKLRDDLGREPIDFLYWATLELMGTDFKGDGGDKGGVARPTKSRKRSGSRRSTSR